MSDQREKRDVTTLRNASTRELLAELRLRLGDASCYVSISGVSTAHLEQIALEIGAVRDDRIMLDVGRGYVAFCPSARAYQADGSPIDISILGRDRAPEEADIPRLREMFDSVRRSQS